MSCFQDLTVTGAMLAKANVSSFCCCCLCCCSGRECTTDSLQLMPKQQQQQQHMLVLFPMNDNYGKSNNCWTLLPPGLQVKSDTSSEHSTPSGKVGASPH